MYNVRMCTRLIQAMIFLVLVGCYPKAAETERRVTETETLVEEDSTGTVTDTAEEEEEESDPGPIGVWSTCNGTLTRDAETFSWEGNLYPCNISGASSFEDGVLALHADKSTGQR